MSEKTKFAGTNGRCCQKCRFFDTFRNVQAGQATTICRYEPKVFAMPIGAGADGVKWTSCTAWPEVKASDFCSHFELEVELNS